MMPSLAERVAIAINEVLSTHGVQHSVSWQEMRVSEAIVVDASPEHKLSEAIIDHVCPPIRQCDGFHFTSESSANSIIASQTFRLANIGKRIQESEIISFCESHGLTGFLDDSTGAPAYRHLIEPNTYFGSFTRTQLSPQKEAGFLGAFGRVRLRFVVEARNPNFRPIWYQSQKGAPVPVIAELQKRIKSEFNRDWILAGFSRLCSFFLPGNSFGWEEEMRILWRSWDDSTLSPSEPGPSGHISLPLGTMTSLGFRLTLTEVCADRTMAVPHGVQFVRRP